MLYNIQKNKSVFDSAPGLRLIASFQALDDPKDTQDRKMRFVMLVADYKSPLRQHPEKQRRKLAAMECGYKIMDTTHDTLDYRARLLLEGKDEKVEAAILKYHEIQYNEDIGNLEMIDRQIDNIKDVIKSPTADLDELKKRNTLLQTLPELVETKKRLARIAGMKEAEMASMEISEDKPLSLIDKIHAESI